MRTEYVAYRHDGKVFCRECYFKIDEQLDLNEDDHLIQKEEYEAMIDSAKRMGGQIWCAECGVAIDYGE